MLSLGKRQFWHNVNPAGALSDFRDVYRQAGRNRLRFGIAAALMTAGVFSVMIQESWKMPPAKPKIVWINSWTGQRSDAEIRASNIAHQKLIDKLRAEQAKRDEEVKKVYRSLGRATGMDVDAIEKDAKAKAAAAAKSAAEKAPAAATTTTNAGSIGQR